MNFRNLFSIKKIVLALVILFAVIQFIRIDKTNPKSDPALDFFAVNTPPAAVKEIMIKACYDCHSHETQYPWYMNVAPVSWWAKDHINEGREELNLSLWSNYSLKKKNHKLEECIELVKEGEMPLNSYVWMHKDAKLSDAQRVLLTDYFQSLRTDTNSAAEIEE
jgi:hypothetical protein